MPIERKMWLAPFQKDNIPNWVCPRCKVGILRPIDNTFHFAESGDIHSEIVQHGEYFDYENYTFRYAVLLKCNNSFCEEHVASGGEGHVDTSFSETKRGLEPSHVEVFVPQFFFPPLFIFSIPIECPESVSSEIKTSFKLFFSDPPASANYVRKAVDAILTNKRVKRFSSTKGKRRLITLHHRIIDFEKKDAGVAKKLLAIKWLGNEGSHANTITKNDVLDAYEILESVLDDLYVGYKKAVERKVSQINKLKKPLHPSS
jgi:hypothetical protein